MGLESSFRNFSSELRKLLEALQELRLTVVEDRPSRNDAVVVDNVEYAMEDMLGWVQESCEAAAVAQQAVGHPADLDRARQALAMCQEKFQRVEQAFSTKLVSYESIKNLTRFGCERKGEWRLWVAAVKQGIERCRLPLQVAAAALVECWKELAERAGMTSISIRTTSIGQKIAVPEQSEVFERSVT
jgi:hypothetical protein